MINLGDAVLFFKGDMNDLDRALGQARAAAEDSLGNMKQLAEEAGKAMSVMGAAITGALGFAIYDFANTGDEINDLSKKIGFSTEEISKWKFALEQSGGNVGTLQTAVRGMANAIDATKKATTESAEALKEGLGEALGEANPKFLEMTAEIQRANSAMDELNIVIQQDIASMTAQGASSEELNAYRASANVMIQQQQAYIQELSGEYDQWAVKADINIEKIMKSAEVTDGAAVAFQRLGINIAELANLSPEQQFMQIAMAVAAVQDPMERLAVAQDIFGKAAMDLLPVLAEGEAGIMAMFDQIERAGGVYTQAEADMADQFNDSMKLLTESFSAVSKQLAIALIPDLIKLMEVVKENVIAFKNWAKANPETAGTLAKVTLETGVFLSVAGPLLWMVPKLTTAFTLLGKAWTLLKPTIMAIGAAIGTVEVIIALAAAAIILIGWSIYENWEEIKAYFDNFWPNLQQTFKDGAQALKESDWFQGMGESVESWTEYSVSKLGDFIGWFEGNFVQALTSPIDFITEYWQWMGEVWDYIVIQIGSGWDFLMTNIIEPAWEWLKEVYDWLVNVFMGAFNDSFDKASGLNTEPAPGFAGGTLSAPGGLAWVGEQGPELMYVPRGAQVYPADQSAAMAAGGGATVNIHIGAVSLPNRAAIQEFNRGLGDEVSRRLSMRGLSTRLA